MDRRSFVWVSAVSFLFALSLASGAGAVEPGASEATQPALTGTQNQTAPGMSQEQDPMGQPAPAPGATAKPAVPPKSERQFQAARESFLKKDLAAAAIEIRKSAAFLRMKAKQATGESKQALKASVQELKRLAAEVEKGAVSSVQELDDAFVRAREALAQRHMKSA